MATRRSPTYTTKPERTRKSRREDLAAVQARNNVSEVDTSADHDGGNPEVRGGTEENLITVARRRFDRSRTKYGPMRQLAIEDTKFAWGDSDNRYQWVAERYEARAKANKVCLTVNVIAQHCNQVINDQRQQRPRMKYAPVDSAGDPKTAEILTALLRNVTSQQSADLAHDTALEHAVYGGEGYWLVTTEFDSPDSFDQSVVIVPIMNPMLVQMDDAAILPDRSDSRWCFVFEDMSKDAYQARFGRYGDVADCASWASDENGGWYDGRDMVRIANYFEAEDVADELWFFEGYGAVLKSQAPEGTPRPAKWRATTRTEWNCHLLAGNAAEPLETTRIPGKLCPVVACIGKEVNINGEIIRKGLVRDGKDQNRIVNYAYSETVQTVAVQNRVPYVAAVEGVEEFRTIWQNADRDEPVYLPYQSLTEDGKAIPRPERQTPPQMNMAQVQLLGLSIEQMRAATGQQNANFGIKSEAQSGIGIQRLKVQGDMATYHFGDNYRRALAYEARVCLGFFQEILDTKRVLRLLGPDGEEETAISDPELGVPYQEIPKPGMGGPSGDLERRRVDEIERIFNPTAGRYDVVIEQGPSVATQRQEASTAMFDIASKNPRLMEIAGDIIFDMADFPQAEKLRDRLKKTLPPGMLGDDRLSALTQQLQQMQQQIQQGSADNQRLARENETLKLRHAGKVIETQAGAANDAAELDIDRFDAQTRRLSAIMPAAPIFDPQALQLAVRDALFAVINGDGMNAPQGGPPQSGPPQGGPPISMQLPPSQPAMGPQAGLPDPGQFAPGP